MIDGVPNGDGDSRYLKTIASALTQYPTYESFMTALINGTFTVDFNGINQAGWAKIGTALNKANLLTDNTARVLSLGSSATVNDALHQLAYALLTEEVEEEITASGSWTMPYNILDDEVQVFVMGGGGGGGGCGYSSSINTDYRSAGGGGAGYVNKATLTLTRGQAYTITIGAGGAGGEGSANGGQGGTTSFGSLLSAEGGKGGCRGGNGTGAGNGGDGSAGGGGGVGGLTTSSPYTAYAGGAGGAGRNSSGGAGGKSKYENNGDDWIKYRGSGGFGGNYNGSNGAAGESYVRYWGGTHNHNGGVGISGLAPGTWTTSTSTSNIGGCGGCGYKGLGGLGAWAASYLQYGKAKVGSGYGSGGGGGIYYTGNTGANTLDACLGGAGTAGICVLKYRRIIRLSEF